MSVLTAIAPAAPGRLGQPLEPTEALRYLDALGAWRDQRRRELAALDEAALASPDPAAFTGDVTLSMALWKAVADRHDLLLATWDSSRVGATERERLATLIWGRLDASAGTVGPMAVSLPEACRLCDALATSLRSRLALDPLDADVGTRLRALRAGVERVREQLATVPQGAARDQAAARTARLAGRVADLAASAQRGGDVQGPLGPLEIECATTERDLIVGAARRREAARDSARARTLRTALQARTLAVRDLAARCIDAVSPAPRLAIPDVDVLGPVPDDADALDGYLARLDRVSRALTMAQDAYAAALERRDELRGRLDAYRAKALQVGVGSDPLVTEAHRAAQTVLRAEPVDLERAEALVQVYRSALAALTPSRSTGRSA